MASVTTHSGRPAVQPAWAIDNTPRKPLAAFSPLVLGTFLATEFGGLECLIILFCPDWHGALCALILAIVFAFNVAMYRHMRGIDTRARRDVLWRAIRRLPSGE